MSIARDYRVNVKVRNARLLRAIEEAGYVSGAKFAALVGIAYQGWLIRYLNLTISPYDKKGDLRPSAEKLCVFLNKGPNELWSEEQLTPLKTNKAEREVSHDQIQYLIKEKDVDSHDPQLLLEQKEETNKIYTILETLKPREQEVLRLHFGLDCKEHTLKDIGKKLGISGNRVMQIKDKALRLLRHPSRSEPLRKIWEDRNITTDVLIERDDSPPTAKMDLIQQTIAHQKGLEELNEYLNSLKPKVRICDETHPYAYNYGVVESEFVMGPPSYQRVLNVKIAEGIIVYALPDQVDFD